jgi:hypothetical protein
MRKSIKQSETDTTPGTERWLDLKSVARVELTSEDERYPIESAFGPGDAGWRAAERGPQTIDLYFDEPQQIRRIRLQFKETEVERTQQFTLRWSNDETDAFQLLFQQQWNFSPGGATSETEDFAVNLLNVSRLQLVIDPDLSRKEAFASLASWRLSAYPKTPP